MTHLITFPAPARAHRNRPGRLARLLDAIRPRRRAAMLDLDNAPEHLLRDLGFIDGRGGSLRHPAWPCDASGWR